MGHDLAPDALDELRLGVNGLRLQALQDLRLAARSHLQVAVALGVLGRRDLDRNNVAAVDQAEDLVVDLVKLGAQSGEPQQLFLGHGLSRGLPLCCGGITGSVCQQNLRPPAGIPARKRDKVIVTTQRGRAD